MLLWIETHATLDACDLHILWPKQHGKKNGGSQLQSNAKRWPQKNNKQHYPRTVEAVPGPQKKSTPNLNWLPKFLMPTKHKRLGPRSFFFNTTTKKEMHQELPFHNTHCWSCTSSPQSRPLYLVRYTWLLNEQIEITSYYTHSLQFVGSRFLFTILGDGGSTAFQQFFVTSIGFLAQVWSVSSTRFFYTGNTSTFLFQFLSGGFSTKFFGGHTQSGHLHGVGVQSTVHKTMFARQIEGVWRKLSPTGMTLFFQKGILFAGKLPDEGGGHYF